MKISTAYLAEQLQSRYQTKTISPLSGKPVLQTPFPGTDLFRKQEGSVVVCDSSWFSSVLDLQEKPGSAVSSSFFVICCSVLQDPVPDANRNRLLVQGSPSSVFSFVQNLFYSLNEWEKTLMQARLEGKSIQTLLNLSYPVFGCPLLVIGLDFTMVASVSEDPTLFSEKIFGSSEETRPLLTALTSNEAYLAARETDHLFSFPKSIVGRELLGVNIKLHEQTAYRLLMLENEKKLPASSGFLLEFLSRMIRHAFLHNVIQKSTPEQSLTTVLLRALDDRSADYVTVSQTLDSLGWYSRQEYCCLYLQLSDLDRKNLTATSVCAYLENILPGCCAFPYRGSIVVFLNLSLAEATMDDILKRMTPFVEDGALNAGFSRCMTGHMNLRRQYIQAKIALQFGTRKYPEKRIHPFNDISFDYILNQATKKLPGYMISHEKLLLLRQHDETYGSEYIETLRCFLDNRCNVVQTARSLFIHRSTLLYRLDKIKELLDSDLSDPDEILYLMLSFRFMDLEQRDNRS